MSLLNTPLWQDLNGNPRAGVAPPTLVVRSGRLTPQRHGEIQQIYMRFSMAKLTAVGDFFVFNRVLTDGTRVRIESMQGRDRVMVWASDAEQAPEWDYGWCFTPANDVSLGGFTRRPGAAPDDFSASAFVAVGNNSAGGKAVYTFVSRATGNRTLCTNREGGARIWRSEKFHAKGIEPGEVLTYDHNAVYVDGEKHVLNFFESVGGATHIDGAALAKRGAEKWVVFIVNETVGAIRLRELKPVNTTYVVCGAAIDPAGPYRAQKTLWEFSPDGMKAIALGGMLPSSDVRPVNLDTIYRLTLVPQNGTVPFLVQATYELRSDAGVKRRVTSSFRFNQATRNFHFQGWRDFVIYAKRSYYGLIRFDLQSGWGPTYTVPGNQEPSVVNPVTGAVERYRLIGAYFDPRMSSRVLNATGSLIVDHVNPSNFTKDDPEVEIPRSDLLFDDGEAPEKIIYTRRFEPSPQNVFPGANTGEVGRWFQHLGGWLMETPVISTFFHSRTNNVWEPYMGAPGAPRHYKYSERLAAATVEQKVPESYSGFASLEELAEFSESRWGAVRQGTDLLSIESTILNNYGQLVEKNDYTSYLAFYEYLAGRSLNLLDREKNEYTYATREVVLDYQNNITTIHEVGQQPAITERYRETTWAEFSYADGNGTVYTELKLVEETTKSAFQERTNAYRLSAAILATPKYLHNWSTDWVLDSSIHLSGKSLLAAGFDAQGQESFIYFEGDESKSLKYMGSVQGRDVPLVDLAWSFSGAFGYRLKLNDLLIDACEYAVTDSVSLKDEEFSNAKPYAGSSPVINSEEIIVHDFDIGLGHVLYRKSREKFSVNQGQSNDRPSIIGLEYSDYLRTKKVLQQLGDTVKIASAGRVIKDGYKFFNNTKTLFTKTAPFIKAPTLIVLDGVTIDYSKPDWMARFVSIIPPSQRSKFSPASGRTEYYYDESWVRYMVLYYPGEDKEVIPVIKNLREYAFPSHEMQASGHFEKSPQSNMQLRAFSEDCWMVCYQNEMYVQGVGNANTTAKYFLKLGKDRPVNQFDAANIFQFLGASKKLLAPKFHMRKKP